MPTKYLLTFVCILLVSSPLSAQLSNVCSKIQGIDNPVNVFHIYFQQIITLLDPSNSASHLWLMYYREQKTKGNYHRFIFRVKYKFRSKVTYIGLVSFVPEKEFDNKKFTHFIVRYIDSARLDDVISLLGVYDVYKQERNDVYQCPNLKKQALRYLSKSQIPIECRAIKIQGCVHASDLTRIFQANFKFIQNALKDFKFGVTLGEMGFNRTILKIYRDTFARFPFVKKAVSQLEDMITDENEVDHAKLIVSSDLREKPKCQDILDLKDLCEREKGKGVECLSEKKARSLINFMITHYMVDTKTVLNPAIFDGKRVARSSGFCENSNLQNYSMTSLSYALCGATGSTFGL